MNFEERQARVQALTEAFRTLTLTELALKGSMAAEHLLALQQAVADRKTILIAGATGTGKTTLLQALANAQLTEAPNTTVALIDDTEELLANTSHHLRYPVSGELPAARQVRRAALDGAQRIALGELRNEGDCTAFLESVGHGASGAATLLATSLGDTYERLMAMVGRERPDGTRLLRQIDLVVFMTRDSEGLRVSELVPMREVIERAQLAKR